AAAAAATSDGWDGIPADVFVDILRRIPPCPRWRLRLVCRHWRDVIDERAPEPRANVTKVLAFIRESGCCRAFVFDDLTTGRSRRWTWRTAAFGYHPATGQYKIVHVLCSEQDSNLDAVLVFTLGDGSWQWREVPAPVGIHGVTYWATKDGKGIMSFDLKDEQVAPVEVPPLPAPGPMEWWRPSCQLTDVGGRLGLRSKTKVWVLEDGSEVEWTWVKRYTVLAHRAYRRQQIPLPHVAHGEHVLTTGEPWERSISLRQTLEAHRPRQERKMRPCGMVRVGAPRPETTVGVYALEEPSHSHIRPRRDQGASARVR
uniref:F-box domain-containing protein n=1 Tax=Setaria italica TaxID=4555 RepID=K3ZD73_SETIT